MKKFILIITIATLAYVGFVLVSKQKPVEPAITASLSPSAPTVTLTLDAGDTVSTISGVSAANAYEALVVAAHEKEMELKTKQYDFGIFIEQIGDKANTQERAWIYFVNGVSGDVAADKKELKQGDIVEWKYIKPEF